MLIIAVAAICAAGFTAPLYVFGSDYNDVGENHWAGEYISAMSASGIIAGFPDGGFRPNETVSYGEFIKMALLAAGGADPGNSAKGNWAETYYDAALSRACFTGNDISKQALPFAIPREYMALIISNILGAAEIEDYTRIQEDISDINYRSKHEYDITKVYAAGIITGYPDKTFRSDGHLNRAEAAAVIYRLVNEDARVLPTLHPEAENGEVSAWERFNLDTFKYPCFANVIMTSSSTKPISDIADRFISGVLSFTPDELPEIFRNLKYYEIMYDYPHKLTVIPDLVGSVSLDFGPGTPIKNTFVWLLKDRTATRLGSNMETFAWVHEDVGVTDVFPDYDYIGFYGGYDDTTMVLIPNKPEN
jgi:hypothetical protein